MTAPELPDTASQQPADFAHGVERTIKTDAETLALAHQLTDEILTKGILSGAARALIMNEAVDLGSGEIDTFALTEAIESADEQIRVTLQRVKDRIGAIAAEKLLEQMPKL